ncbi:LPD7 domain-containing protein [Paraburkholderia sp. BR10872]|uniref:LPD7 domain-containing protein n=1 Tax=Paraburkholderia sp. BR10872 TaxID=3236989 RepID=UPI0034D34783
MMDETATPTTPAGTSADDPVINVIEPVPPPLPDPPGGSAGADRFDQTAADTLAARRRREFDAVRARLRDEAIQATQAQASQQAAAQQPAWQQATPKGSDEAATMRWLPLGNPPEIVRTRYLRAGNQYFLKDTPHQLAFEDIGPYLVTEHNRPDVVESMVEMVRAKSWRRVRVSGHQQFRREVWVQAMLLGIEVTGYEPKAVDLARLAEGRRGRMTNRVEVTETTAAARAPADVTKASATARRSAQSLTVQTGKPDASRQPEMASAPPLSAPPLPPAPASEPAPRVAESENEERQRYAGKLVEHGGAPYQHNPARSDSYYVVYRDAGGADHVVWGVDLARAVAESGALAGQQVTLQNLRRHLVSVAVPVIDERGNVTGEAEKEVYRNTWQVDVVGQERTHSRPGAVGEKGEPGGAKAAEPAASEPVHAARRREPPRASPDERAVQMAVLTAAMRQHGLSERSIARVQQHAQRLLEAFVAEGVTVPPPRVFEPQAPSTRNRRPRAVAERVAAREVERGREEPAPPSL